MSVTHHSYGVQTESIGTMVLIVDDPAGENPQVGFYVTDGTGVRTGPVGPTRRPSPGVYEKDVELDFENETLIEAVRIVANAEESWESQSFPRIMDRVVTLVQGSRMERGATIELGAGLTLSRAAGLHPVLEGGSPSLALANFREVERTATEVAFAWIAGPDVAEVHLREIVLERPVPADPWAFASAPFSVLDPTAESYRAPIPAPGHIRYLQFEPRAASLAMGPVQRVVIEGQAESKPVIEHISQSPASHLSRTDLRVVLTDAANRPGTLRAWLNRGSPDSADPDAAPDGTIELSMPRTVTSADVWNLTGGGTAKLFDEILTHASRGKRIFLEYVTAEGATSGKVTFELLNWLDIIDGGTGELVNGAIKHALQFAEGIDPVLVRATLPATNAEGNTVLLTVDSKLYRWTGSGWTAAVPAGDLSGQISAGQIAAGAVKAGHLDVGSVTSGTIAAGAIHSETLLNSGIISTRVLAASAVTSEKIATGEVTANKIRVAELSQIERPGGGTIGLGIIVSGRLRNPSDTAGLNLDAGAGQGFLYHPGLVLYGPGSSVSAVFTGQLRLSTNTSTNRIAFAHDGSDVGELAFFYDGSTTYARLSMGGDARVDFYSTHTHFTRPVFVNAGMKVSETLEIGGTARPTWVMTNAVDLIFSANAVDQFKISSQGGGVWAKGYHTLSPKPPKPASQMSAGDWLEWGVRDARKPVWPHEGVPSGSHPAVVAEARRTRRDPDVVASAEMASHGKDVGKIAIGTARWADAVWAALREAADFDEFKRLLLEG